MDREHQVRRKIGATNLCEPYKHQAKGCEKHTQTKQAVRERERFGSLVPVDFPSPLLLAEDVTQLHTHDNRVGRLESFGRNHVVSDTE